MSRLRVENNIVPPAVLNEIVEALSSIQFGSIEIQIHNGVVVQLERKEKNVGINLIDLLSSGQKPAELTHE